MSHRLFLSWSIEVAFPLRGGLRTECPLLCTFHFLTSSRELHCINRGAGPGGLCTKKTELKYFLNIKRFKIHDSGDCCFFTCGWSWWWWMWHCQQEVENTNSLSNIHLTWFLYPDIFTGVDQREVKRSQSCGKGLSADFCFNLLSAHEVNIWSRNVKFMDLHCSAVCCASWQGLQQGPAVLDLGTMDSPSLLFY